MRILDSNMQKSARERTKKLEEATEELLKERKELYKKLAKKWGLNLCWINRNLPVNPCLIPTSPIFNIITCPIIKIKMKSHENTLKAHQLKHLSMSNDIESSQYDIGTTSIRLVRVGNVIQILFSSSLEAKYLYKELAERYKRSEDKLKGV